jgi:hypothetical protein
LGRAGEGGTDVKALVFRHNLARDNHNPLVGTLNLSTGQITPLGNTFGSPKGLLFLPSEE